MTKLTDSLHLLRCAFINDALNLLTINVRKDWLVDASKGTLSWLRDLRDKWLWIWVFVVVQLLSKFLWEKIVLLWKENYNQYHSIVKKKKPATDGENNSLNGVTQKITHNLPMDFFPRSHAMLGKNVLDS